MYCNEQKVLNLTLQRVPFELMEAGRKPVEYRKGGEWIRRLVAGKKYSHVKFTNGYGPQFPYFVAVYNGFVIAKKSFRKVYDCGLVVDVEPGDYIIILGKIVERGNLDYKPKNLSKNAKKSIARVFRHKIW